MKVSLEALFSYSYDFLKGKIAKLALLEKRVAFVAALAISLFAAAVNFYLRWSKKKLSISERLEKNLQFAAAQQNQETPKGFKIRLGQMTPRYKSDIREETVNGRKVGIASCIGRRDYMEDAEYAGHHFFKIAGREVPFDLFGIFDGHGKEGSGREASDYVKEHLVEYLIQEFENKNREILTEKGIWDALKTAFTKLDEDYQGKGGSTATVAIFLENKVWVPNVGDSRTIFVKDGLATQATEDAKPLIGRYQKKIAKLGGRVIVSKADHIARVEEDLSVARAIGDKDIKGSDGRCCISPHPKITCYSLDEFKGGYLILACDGLYDRASTNEIGTAVELMARKNLSEEEMASRSVYSAIANGSTDNVSVMVIRL